MSIITSTKKPSSRQREIGVDVPNFAESIAPRVAARTRHHSPSVKCATWKRSRPRSRRRNRPLVFGTLHTTGAAKPLTVSQTLPRTSRKCPHPAFDRDGGGHFSKIAQPRWTSRGACPFEIMINTPSIAALIRDNKIPHPVGHQTGSKLEW